MFDYYVIQLWLKHTVTIQEWNSFITCTYIYLGNSSSYYKNGYRCNYLWLHEIGSHQVPILCFLNIYEIFLIALLFWKFWAHINTIQQWQSNKVVNVMGFGLKWLHFSECQNLHKLFSSPVIFQSRNRIHNFTLKHLFCFCFVFLATILPFLNLSVHKHYLSESQFISTIYLREVLEQEQRIKKGVITVVIIRYILSCLFQIDMCASQLVNSCT